MQIITENTHELFIDSETLAVDARFRTMNLSFNAVLCTLLFCFSLIFFKLELIEIAPHFHWLENTIYGALACLCVVLMAYHWFADPRVRYAIRERDVVLHKGLFFSLNNLSTYQTHPACGH